MLSPEPITIPSSPLHSLVYKIPLPCWNTLEMLDGDLANPLYILLEVLKAKNKIHSQMLNRNENTGVNLHTRDKRLVLLVVVQH